MIKVTAVSVKSTGGWTAPVEGMVHESEPGRFEAEASDLRIDPQRPVHLTFPPNDGRSLMFTPLARHCDREGETWSWIFCGIGDAGGCFLELFND